MIVSVKCLDYEYVFIRNRIILTKAAVNQPTDIYHKILCSKFNTNNIHCIWKQGGNKKNWMVTFDTVHLSAQVKNESHIFFFYACKNM